MRRRLLFPTLFVVLIVCVVDVAASLVFRVVTGSFFWQASSETSVFNVWPFTELVPDERIITLKRSFTYVDSPQRQSRWTMTTDPNGFRVGDYHYYRDRPNVVFLGDSVPFGWGVEDNESVPSAFRRMMPGDHGQGIINAAVPSYSLYQTVKRFEYEVLPNWPVTLVIVQVYDPVGQFLIWGRQWDERMSWSSKDTLASTRGIAESAAMESSHSSTVHRMWRFMTSHSAILSVLGGVWSRAFGGPARPRGLDMDDGVAFDRFESQNRQLLERLLSSATAAKARLVLLPANPRRHLAQYNEAGLHRLRSRVRKNLIVVDRLNRIFQRFAAEHPDVCYLDLVSSFDGEDRRTLYLRDGLHLSPLGAERQARFIFEELTRRGLM